MVKGNLVLFKNKKEREFNMSDAKEKTYENIEDALMFCIRSSNKEVKQVAAALWPSDPVQTSYNRLLDALNPNKRQKLSMNEIIFIMHFCDRYDPLHYMEDECLHTRSTKKKPEIDAETVQKRFEQMLEESTRAYQQFQKLTEKRDQIDKIRSGEISYLELVRKVAI